MIVLGVIVVWIFLEKMGNVMSMAEFAVYLVLAALRRYDVMLVSVWSCKFGVLMGNVLSECEVMILGWGVIGVKIVV